MPADLIVLGIDRSRRYDQRPDMGALRREPVCWIGCFEQLVLMGPTRHVVVGHQAAPILR
jgi:hypothetical protein